jgi:copper resistance protein C
MRAFFVRIPVSFAFALFATQAFAHAQLEKATPAVGGTVASASEIRLEFSEGVEPRFTGVALTLDKGGGVPLGAARVDGSDQKVFVTPVSKPLAPGLYHVRWHAVSVDTHRTQGSFDFTVK